MAESVNKAEKSKKAEKTVKSLDELQKELFVTKKSFIEGTLQNPHRIKALKKEIARSKTLINKGKGA